MATDNEISTASTTWTTTLISKITVPTEDGQGRQTLILKDAEARTDIWSIKENYVLTTTLTTELAKKVSKSGDTMTGTLVAPIIQTGTASSNYFQSQKFRGEGNASSYYHAVDFGYSGHNQVDFYEYGGTFNFWKNENSTATSDASNRVASLQLGKLVERANTLTYPGKSGTFALTSDIPTVNNGTLTIQTEGTSKGTFTANQSGNTTINITASDLGLSGAMKFLGTSTTAITDGATTNPITIDGKSVTATAGNVVLYGSKEFVWTGSLWEELGDESSHALKSVTITGTGILSGGGSLEANRTITHNTVSRTDSTSAASPSYSGTFTAIDSITSDSYGHISKVNTKTITLPASYTLPTATSTALGGFKIGYTASGKNYPIQLDSDGKGYVTVNWTDTTYSTATTSANGLMSPSDKSKLDGIAANANNYSLPIASSSTLGGFKVGSGLSIASDGTLSATGGTSTSYTITLSGKGTLSGDTKIASDGTAICVITANTGLNYISLSASGANIVLDTELSSSQHMIILSGATKNVTLALTTLTPVSKGDLISMSLGNATPAAGSNNQYRVLNISGTVAEVVAMYDISTSQKFSSSSQTYSGSLLDTALNTTWYGTLNATAKAAIVDKTFKQDSWYWGTSGSPVYSGYYGTSNPGTSSYSVSLWNASFGSKITRKVYALSLQDVLDYVTDTSVGDGKLQNYNIWKLFWNTTSQPSNYTYPWLRSALASNSSSCWVVCGSIGYVSGSSYDDSLASRPALTIDLSKIDFSVV